MELFRHALFRLAGGDFEDLAGLDFVRCREIFDRVHLLYKTREQLKEKISTAIHLAVASAQDETTKKKLLNLRRDIYNDRAVKEQGWQLLATSTTSPEFHQWILDYRENSKEAALLLEKGHTVFTDELASERQQLHALLQQDKIQKGLVLSSRSLLEACEKYFGRAAGPLDKKELHTEHSLLKYLSRIYAKISPFSTFNSISTGCFTDAYTDLYGMLPGGSTEMISHIFLNNLAFRRLKTLITHDEQIYERLPIRINPTVMLKNGAFSFLTNANNHEVFHKIPVSDFLILLEKMVRAGELNYSGLIEAVITNEKIKADPAQLRQYLDKLIAVGFFDLSLGVSGTDTEWDIKLSQLLETRIGSQHEKCNAIIRGLEKLRGNADAYALADVAQRGELLYDSYEIYNALLTTLEAGMENKNAQLSVRERFTLKPEQLFLEDTTVDASFFINREKITALVRVYDEMLRNLQHFEPYLPDECRMEFYFKNKYPEQERVSVLQFYEDFYRDVMTKIEEREKDSVANPGYTRPEFGPVWKEKKAQQKKWYDLFVERLRSNPGAEDENCIYVSNEDIRYASEKAGMHSDSEVLPRSFSLFFQGWREGKGYDYKYVVNASWPGFGKMFSRFLHILDPAIAEELRRQNAAYVENGKYVCIENTDASYFNANIHPPVAPYEVRIPGSHNNLPEAQQLEVSDFYLERQPGKDTLQLIHAPSKKEPMFLNAGFESPGKRSQLFQILDRFGPGKWLSGGPVIMAIENQYYPDSSQGENAPPVLIRKRIVLENLIVLRRKQWIIKKEIIPVQKPGESDWLFFSRLDAWRRKLSVPEEVFVRVVPELHNRQLTEEQLKYITKDDYKPQYINFSSFFFASLFSKMIRKVPVYLEIAEMLPGREDIIPVNEKRRVTEIMVQWYDAK